MSHTPGPWSVGPGSLVINLPDGRAVALMAGTHWGNAEPTLRESLVDNARLIAAAPELLQELKRLLPMWEEAIGWEKEYMDMGDAARAAIAKAEGRTHADT